MQGRDEPNLQRLYYSFCSAKYANDKKKRRSRPDSSGENTMRPGDYSSPDAEYMGFAYEAGPEIGDINDELIQLQTQKHIEA